MNRLILAFINIGTALAATAALCDVAVTDLEVAGADSVQSDEIGEMIRLAAQVVRNHVEPG